MILSDPGRRAAVSALLLGITILMGWSASSLRVDPGAESMLPVEGDDLPRLQDFNAMFGSDEIIVLALHADALFSARYLGFIDQLTQRAQALPHVRSVLGPTTVQDVDGDELGPYRVTPYEAVSSGKMTPEELGRTLASHALFGDLLVGGAGPGGIPRTAAILIEVERIENDAGYRDALVRQVRKLVRGAPDGLQAYVAGITVEKVDLAASVHRDQRIFAPLILLMLAGATFALYRYPTGMLVPLSVVVVSLVWTLGLYGLAGRALNPVTSLVTPVVLVVSVGGVLHLMSHFLAARAEGIPRHDALDRGVRRCRVPALNAALTTSFGLLSLWLLPIPAIRDFGMFSAVGVMVSYVLTMTLAPLLLFWLPDPPSRVTGSMRRGRIERALQAAVAWVFRHPITSSLLWAGALALAVVGATRVRVETDVIRSLKPGSPLYGATMFIDRNLTGVNSLEILVRGVAPDDLSGLRQVAAFEGGIRSLSGMRKVTGLPDLYSRVNRAFHGGDDAFERLPEGPDAAEALADIRWLLEEQAPEELSRFVSSDGRTMRLAGRATALDSASSQRLFDGIRAAAREEGLDDVILTGNFVVLSNMSTSLVRNQVKGLVVALALILTALVVQFRSLRLGLLGLLPTAAPILIVYGLMGWTGIALSVPTAMIACVALGITVDSTIHLMARFRAAFERTGGYQPALQEGLRISGRPIAFSTITLSLGFCVGASSSFAPSVHFAVLTGATLLVGLLCVVLLLPLMLILFRPLGNPRTVGATSRAGTLALLIAFILLLPASAAASMASEAADPMVLKDQYGREDAVARYRGTTVLLLYGKAAALRRMKSWELMVTERAGSDLVVLRGLDARAARGKKTEDEVNTRLQKAVPPEISLLVDWNGELARAYDIPDANVTVTVIAPDGTSCGTQAGSPSPESVEKVLDLIAHLDETESCP